jgi:glycosyltransferase involved in cell wall biosynthesis
MPGYRSDLRNIFSAMDLFVYPSIEKDTSPLALISAISFGLPVVISSINTLEEILRLCPSLDTFNLNQIDGIISLMEKYEDESQQLIIGEINRKNGVKHFDISVHGLKMGVIFRRINKSA